MYNGIKHNRKIAVVGLGYVGLPVALAFGQAERIIAFDNSTARVEGLQLGIDKNQDVDSDDLRQSKARFTTNVDDLKSADFYIVAVPTPVDQAKKPDLTPLLGATETVGKSLTKGDIVVFESTVYPGATEEDCVPVLERVSGLTFGKDFSVGYSPERINPGDVEHTFSRITKVVSGSDKETLEVVADVYGSVVTAGVHRAASIKVAEAAKVIENTQRDLNIALMNELALVFSKMDIDTQDVLAAAGTKWNFLPFTPGLVGGHCIGVDPYYLTHKAEMMGYIPEVILAGRKINDGMGSFIAQRTVKEMIRKGQDLKDAVVTVLGLTFKEGCSDLRNSKVIDIIREFQSYGLTVQVHDPNADGEEAAKEYGVELCSWVELKRSSAIVVAVAHESIRAKTVNEYKQIMAENCVVFDVKGVCSREEFSSLSIPLLRL